ncbi:MAG: response regulator [Ignavibacteriaceae bacterium]|jgi:CheY-like chemotaxis protein
MDEPKKPKVLVVEDDYENQRFLQLFLKKNFIVFACDSEKSFYQYLNNYHIDVILMDISLRGEKDGLQLTREIKGSERFKDIPVVCLTAHAFQQDRENALNAGVDIFLTKPVDNSYLMETLLNMLKD